MASSQPLLPTLEEESIENKIKEVNDYFISHINKNLRFNNIQNRKLKYGLTMDDKLIIGSNDYDYTSDAIFMALLNKTDTLYTTNEFNSDLNYLPANITSLHLGGNFNRPIDNLPIGLKKLTIRGFDGIFNCMFNQPLDCLPIGLEYLHIDFTTNFNQKLDNLPINLKYLYIHNKVFYKLNISLLPNSLILLYVNDFEEDNNIEIQELPKYLKYMYFSTDTIHLIEKYKKKFADRDIQFLPLFR